jgi:hypothetical protein
MMTFVRREYREITDAMLAQITKGIISEKYEHTPSRTKYRLAYPNAAEALKVDGILKGMPATFGKGTDYAQRQRARMAPGWREADPARRSPSTTGSTCPGHYRHQPRQRSADARRVRILEFDYLNAQMNQAYNAGFIDTAPGKSLDLVVSILGISRKMAGYASGEVTFGRKRDPPEVAVSREAHVYDGKDRYDLKNPMIKAIKAVEGTADGAKASYARGKDFEVRGGAIAWLPAGKKPDQSSVFYVDYNAYEKIVIPLDARVSTYSRRPDNVKVFRTVRESCLTKNPEGRWEVDVPVARSPRQGGQCVRRHSQLCPSRSRHRVRGQQERHPERNRREATRSCATGASVPSEVAGKRP